ncbi:DUF2177 family protein [Jannaschia rubra]|uniref:Putative membrane protein n=1 Tax=Jannaschia rubra TaxID=282197 RepID=A0A0M6XQH5_9RHOB|nr:DUF2177 family protein [Jannaschia rubra]CTQ32453.1 putative membrane protein [Jannaschia rubra]SFF82545.1 Uncharacterized membrane protein [Jannaschia rubra]
MQFFLLYLTTLTVFAVLDAAGLTFVMKPLFQRHLGDLLLSPINLAPAVGFYLFYIAGLVWLVSMPALRDGSVGQAALNGAILGALAYGTYEFTNMSTLRGWDWTMVAVDTSWGTLLTACSAAAGVWAVRLMA